MSHGLTWNIGGLTAQTGYMSSEALYLNGDKTQVVKGDSPDAAFLLVGKGGYVDEGTYERYGLGEFCTALEDITPLPSGERLLFVDPQSEEELEARGYPVRVQLVRGVESARDLHEAQQDTHDMRVARQVLRTGERSFGDDPLLTQGVPTNSPQHPMNVGREGASEETAAERASEPAPVAMAGRDEGAAQQQEQIHERTEQAREENKVSDVKPQSEVDKEEQNASKPTAHNKPATDKK
jgi:hypothetical protein